MPIEANRDEAIRCRELAEKAQIEGDIAKCTRLLEKSLRLYRDTHTEAMLESINRAAKHTQFDTGVSDPTATVPRLRKMSPTRGASSFSQEQVAGVRRILSLTSYYELLQIDKSATDDQIKKAYRKLALRFHPDKCKAPQAEDAFKKISKAFQCLSDAYKRKMYDASGRDSDDPVAAHSSKARFHTDEMSAQDIFEAFFGMPHGRIPRNRQSHRNQFSAGNDFLRFVPILILFGLSIISAILQQVTTPSPRFSLTPTPEMKSRTTTSFMEVPYFTKPDHASSYPIGSTSRTSFDKNVEVAYIQSLFNDCQYEDRVVNHKVQMAKRRGDLTFTEPAKPSCDKLEALRSRFPSEFSRRISSWGEL